jgi:DNA polymerase-3 subunit alpha
MTALLSSVLDDQDKIKYYMAECKNMGIKLMPPDINLSGVNFTADIQNNSIRFGLAAIKNVGVPAVNEIIRARSENGIFKSLSEFCGLVDLRPVNKKTLESLIKSGAFDSLKQSRKEMITSLERIVGLAQKQKELLLNGQLNLFGTQETLLGLSNGNSLETSNGSGKEMISEYSQKEMQLMEKELTGFYISSHPMENIPELIQRATTCNLAELREMPDNTEVLVIAVLNEVDKKLTKTNKIIGILQLEDMLGKVEAVIFSEQLLQFGEFILPETTLMILGRVQQRSEGNISLQIKSLHPLEEIKILSIHLPEEIIKNSDTYTTIHSIRNILQKQKQNRQLDLMGPFFITRAFEETTNKSTIPILILLIHKIYLIWGPC